MNVKPIKILHVIGIMNRGGAETMIMNLYRNIDHNMVQFDFVENTYEKGTYEDEIIALGGRVFHCPKFNGNAFSYMKWWDRFFDQYKEEYAFVHGHIGSTASMYLLSAKKHGIKTIAHSHNTYASTVSLSQLRYRIISYPTRFIADYFFACSEDAGIDRFGHGVKVYIVKNAIDTKLYKYSDRKRIEIRKELGISNNSFVIGNVARFYPQKNHSFLLEVFKSVLNNEKNSLLLLAGDGPLKHEIERRASEMGISDKILFLGVREDIPDLLSVMDIMVFPSLYEGFGIAALEAQANGLRVICSDGVSKECAITEYFYSMNLNEGAKKWALKLLQLRDYNRITPDEQIISAGYDIKENAKWLQDFYLKEDTNNA